MLLLLVPTEGVTYDGPGNLAFLKSQKYKPHIAITRNGKTYDCAKPARARRHYLLEPGLANYGLRAQFTRHLFV